MRIRAAGADGLDSPCSCHSRFVGVAEETATLMMPAWRFRNAILMWGRELRRRFMPFRFVGNPAGGNRFDMKALEIVAAAAAAAMFAMAPTAKSALIIRKLNDFVGAMIVIM